MTNHFECIGLTFEGEDRFHELIERLAAETPFEDSPTGRFGCWRDPSGAALAIQLGAAGDLVCATPTFLARSRLPAVARAVVSDAECPYCDRIRVDVFEGGDPEFYAYPLHVQVEDMDRARDAIVPGERLTLAVTCFAHELDVWADEDAFNRSQASKEVQFAAESLIPTGTFGEGGEAHAQLTGRILEARVRTNEATRDEFQWARVRTFGGDYDLVARVGPSIAEGAIVQVSGWLVARRV